MKQLLCLLVLCGFAFAQQSARVKQAAKTNQIGTVFARAALKTLYEIRDGGSDVNEALQAAELESDQRPAEQLTLKNLRDLRLKFTDLSDRELFAFQYALERPLPKQPPARVLLAIDCYHILESALRSRLATAWPMQCNLKP